jgi:DNA modification methylase
MGIVKEERIGGQRLILGDCLKVMPLLGRFDAGLTDPPYGIGIDGNKASSGKHGGRKAHEQKNWDSVRPPPVFFDMFLQITDAQIIWGGNYFADLLPPSMRWLVWDKGQRIQQSDGELAWTSQNKALRIMTMNRVALLMDGTIHPTQKPLSLIEWCLGFLPDAKTILDPFGGSGTTAVACQKMGKQCTIIEKDEGYFIDMCRRVDEAARQPDLFIAPAAPAPKQEGFDL